MIYLGHNFIEISIKDGCATLPNSVEPKRYVCDTCKIYAWFYSSKYNGGIYYSLMSPKEFHKYNKPMNQGCILNITCNEMVIKNIIE